MKEVLRGLVNAPQVPPADRHVLFVNNFVISNLGRLRGHGAYLSPEDALMATGRPACRREQVYCLKPREKRQPVRSEMVEAALRGDSWPSAIIRLVLECRATWSPVVVAQRLVLGP